MRNKKVAKQSSNAPDGGWGWIVAFAAFLAYFSLSGIFYSFSTLLPVLVDAFNQTRFTLSWISSVQMGCCSFISPFGNALISKIGFRLVGFIGSLIASIGMLTSSFATHYAVLYVTMGITVGCGQGLHIIATMSMVSLYFEKRRPLATGIAYAGGGIGVFFFGQILPIIIDKYSWKGSCIIMSAVLLHGCIGASLLRPLPQAECLDEPLEKEEIQENFQLDMSREHIAEATHHSEECFPRREASSIIVRLERTSQKNLSLTGSSASPAGNTSVEAVPISVLHGSGLIKGKSKRPSTSPHRSNVFFASMETISSYPLVDKKSNCGFFKLLVNYHLFKDGLFCLFCATLIFSLFAYHPPFIYLVDKAIIMGYDMSEAKHFLSIVGICNCCSRVFFGLIGSYVKVDRQFLLLFGFVGVGLANGLFPFCGPKWSIIVFCVIAGISMGVVALLQTVVLFDMVENPEDLPSALAIHLILSGVPVLLSSPFSGAIYDSTKNHNYIYFFCGGIMLTTALAYIPIIIWRRRRNLVLTQTSTDSTTTKVVETPPLR